MKATLSKRELPVIICFIVVLTMVVPFFLNIPTLAAVSVEITRMLVPIAGFALALGGAGLILRHMSIVYKRGGTWPFSIVLIATFLLFIILTLVPGLEGLYTTAYVTVIGRVNETVYALIAVFMATMAYRAFKMKSLEAFLFGMSCLIVLLGNAPIGEIIWGQSPGVTSWLMDFPNMAAMRAVNISVAFGILAYGIRTMLGYERIALGDVEIRKGRKGS